MGGTDPIHIATCTLSTEFVIQYNRVGTPHANIHTESTVLNFVTITSALRHVEICMSATKSPNLTFIELCREMFTSRETLGTQRHIDYNIFE